MTTPIAAANAYASLARLDRSVRRSRPRRVGEATGGPSFGDAAQGRRSASLDKPARKSDAQTQAMAAGKANIVDVVTAVAETEVAIEALVAVRDQVIQAYEEIMRMPI